MNKETASVIQKIDKLLEDDSNFTTRMGLRFMTTIMKEAISVISEHVEDRHATNTRLSAIEGEIKEFLESQSAQRASAEAERVKWRWAIITPIIVLIITQIASWILR